MNWQAFWTITLGLPAVAFTFILSRMLLDWIEVKFGLAWSAAFGLILISAMIGAAVGSFGLWCPA